MRDPRLMRMRAAAAVCLGLAGWCSLGVLTLTAADASAARVGILPPWWMLGALVTGFFAALTVLNVSSPAALPLCATAVLVVPWLPVPLPAAALVWAGPFGALVWVCALAGSLVAGAGSWPERPWTVAWRDPVRAPWVAFVLSLLVYTGAGWRIAPVLPGGDEPHYLIITQSLLTDGDLRIENNHTRGDYLAYAGGPLKPDYLRRGLDREIYSIHLPGISVVAAPAFAAGGYPLTKIWLGGLAAAATAVAWRAAFVLTAQVSAAWFAWAATALTAPFLFLAFTVYPDGSGGALVMVSLAALVWVSRRGNRPVWWWALAGLPPAALPWLHPRFSILAASIGMVFAGRAWAERRRMTTMAALLAVPAVSALGWFGYYVTIYGSPNPSVAYGHYTQMAVSNLPRGLLGLLFDQQFGLLAGAPVYVVAFAGLVVWLRRERRLAFEWLAVVLPYVAVTAMYHMWWGGHSSPARFLGPVMLACALPAAVAWQATTNAGTRLVQAFLLGTSLALAAGLVWIEHGRLIFNVRDGLALWAVWATRSADLARGLPSLFRAETATAAASAAIWAASAVSVWLLSRTLAARTRAGGGAMPLAFTIAVVVATSVSMTATWNLEHGTGVAPAAGQLALLNRAASQPGGVGIVSAPPEIGPAASVVPRVRIDGGSQPGRPAWAWFWLPRVPAGRYRIWFDNLVPANAFDVDIVIGRGDTAAETWRLQDLAPGPVSHELILPRSVRSLAVRGDRARRARLGAIHLEAIDVNRAEGDTGQLVTAARRYGETLVMGVGESVYLEPPGLWVGGRVPSEIVVAGPPGRSEQRVVLRVGPVSTGVEVQSGGWGESFTLPPGGTRELALPLRPGVATAMRIKTDNGFRPSTTDPASTDTRYLGAWIEFPVTPDR